MSMYCLFTSVFNAICFSETTAEFIVLTITGLLSILAFICIVLFLVLKRWIKVETVVGLVLLNLFFFGIAFATNLIAFFFIKTFSFLVAFILQALWNVVPLSFVWKDRKKLFAMLVKKAIDANKGVYEWYERNKVDENPYQTSQV